MRGEEIMSGSQRIHDADLLTERAKHHNVGELKLVECCPKRYFYYPTFSFYSVSLMYVSTILGVFR